MSLNDTILNLYFNGILPWQKISFKSLVEINLYFLPIISDSCFYNYISVLFIRKQFDISSIFMALETLFSEHTFSWRFATFIFVLVFFLDLFLNNNYSIYV